MNYETPGTAYRKSKSHSKGHRWVAEVKPEFNNPA